MNHALDLKVMLFNWKFSDLRYIAKELRRIRPESDHAKLSPTESFAFKRETGTHHRDI
jgi:hypothetical protein